MKYLRMVALAYLLASVLSDSTAAADKKTTISDLSWLAGCWVGSEKGTDLLEQWMRPAGGMMLGMSRTVVGGKTVAFEFVQLREQDGDIYYVAKPSQQEEAAFKLIRAGAGEAVFENPIHDFPQRIIYKLQPDGSLMAAIEGTEGGNGRRIEYPMKRGACE